MDREFLDKECLSHWMGPSIEWHIESPQKTYTTGKARRRFIPSRNRCHSGGTEAYLEIYETDLNMILWIIREIYGKNNTLGAA
jgi:hypothetical protein